MHKHRYYAVKMQLVLCLSTYNLEKCSSDIFRADTTLDFSKFIQTKAGGLNLVNISIEAYEIKQWNTKLQKLDCVCQTKFGERIGDNCSKIWESQTMTTEIIFFTKGFLETKCTLEAMWFTKIKTKTANYVHIFWIYP